jgi:hypothetical protein
MREVLTDAARRVEMRERGIAQAARFAWTRAAEETLAVYHQSSANRASLHARDSRD